MPAEVPRKGWERWSRWAAYGLLGLGVLALPFAIHTTIDNRLEIFLNPDSDKAAQYDQFREAFGSDEFVIAAYWGKDIFDQQALDVQLEVLARMEKAPHVKRVSGIPQVYREVFGGEDAPELKADFLSTPFYQNFLISQDGTVAGLLLETEQPKEILGRRELMDGIHAGLEPLRTYGFQVEVVGPPALHIVMEDVSQREAMRTFPVALVCSIVILLFLFRSLRATVVALFCTGLTVVLTMGFMSAIHQPLNMATSILPVLLWVLALANLIHVIRRYQEYRVETPSVRLAIRQSLSETALPCALAIFTTVMGFLSLLVATLVPIRQLGLYSAVGLTISLAVNLSVGPLFVEWFRVKGLTHRQTGLIHWAHSASTVAMRHSWVVLGAAAVLILLTVFGLTQIRVESNTLTFLPDDSETVQGYNFVSQHLTGLYSLEVVVSTPSGWLEDGNWPALEQLVATMSAEPGVARVVSPIDLLKKLNQWDHEFDPAAYALPETGADAKRLVDELDETGQKELTRLVGPEGKSVRLSVLVRDMDSTRFMAIARHAEKALAQLPKPLSGYVTGIVLQMADAQLKLVETQVRSFGLAFLSVFLCIFIGLRSWRMTAVSFLPNLMPVLCTFGVMALWQVTLDPATVMVASVGLGIAVDNAIHMLSAYQRYRRAGASIEHAVYQAIEKVGPAITITTITACIGFFALARSAFIPIRYFGILAGLSMLVALSANVFLVPAILSCRGTRHGEGEGTSRQSERNSGDT